MRSSSPVHLSKSKFTAGVQCLKRLYFEIYQPEFAVEVDPETQAIFDQGHEVGLLAQAASPGGVAVPWDQTNHEAAIEETARLMADPTVPAIFEATFAWRDVLVRVDILERLPRRRWRLIEVKSTTKVKDEHIADVAIQRYVLRGCGLRVPFAGVMHLNRQYVYDGRRLRLKRLFHIEDVTKEVAKFERGVPALLQQQWAALKRKSPPQIDPGPQCKKPYVCDFFDQCNEQVPDDHVSLLPRIGAAKVADLVDIGITRIVDIPDDFPLGGLARRACGAMQQGSVWFSDDLHAGLLELKYPLAFLDFETIYPAIPRHGGMRPFDHIPFQWSVHHQQEPGAEPEHFEFLAADNSDPRRQFLETLCRVLKGKGHIVVYNRSFESVRLSELAARLPEYAGRIEQIQNRLWDLLPFIRQNVYHADFRGSYSIKDVLPALIPEMTYEGMEVGDGTQAGLAWECFVCGGLDEPEKMRLRKSLLAYCAQDTLAMVRLLALLKRTASGRKARTAH
jgi:predicted RecB family nuclease